ncbi:MAG: LytTR family DNA-binding domain-containing protein [Butyrivibrio sp.]|nr:LytTR family DNA-binding domain-containing protein [Butyrivibrio sp.]
MIQLAIVDDEESYSSQLVEFVSRYQLESGNLFEITRYKDGDEIVNGFHLQFDIILMDIQMKFMDGMSAAEEIRKRDQKVIIMFITNMTDYAIRGYQVDALDYILKPVSYFAFSQKLDRAVARLDKRSGYEMSVTVPAGLKRISSDDLLYIESEGHNLIFHTGDGDFQTRAKMKDYEEELLPHGFFRSNKGYLVNLRYVDGVEDGCCVIRGQKLLISRARKNDFMEALTKYISEA